jgi:hypothetical protein
MKIVAINTVEFIYLFSIVKGVQRCLTFWYHMYGSDMGTLNVLVDGNPVWTKTGDQGNSWKMANITIRRTTRYRVESLYLHVHYVFLLLSMLPRVHVHSMHTFSS